MSREAETDGFQRWQFGVAILALMALSGSIGAGIMLSLDVPHAGAIGTVVGAVAAFLAFSYWFYGR